MQTVAIGIFCKTPAPGLSKTRLSPPLRPDECAAISACFIRDLTATIADVARDGASVGYAVYTPVGTETRAAHAAAAGLPAAAAMRGGFRGAPDDRDARTAAHACGRHHGQCRQPDLAGLDSERGRQRHAARQRRRAQPGARRRLHADRRLARRIRGFTKTSRGAPRRCFRKRWSAPPRSACRS